MKFNYSKIFLSVFILFAVSLFTIAFTMFPTGYVGTTKKYGENLGCICHGSSPTNSVTVTINGPDSVPVGQIATYTISISNGPAVVGGFNVAVDTGMVDVLQGDTTVRKQEYPTSSGVFELTHTNPKAFNSNSVSWSFKYTAPNFVTIDTLYATGNSTNNDNSSDNDQWNWSANKNIRVYNPIGIINISSIAKDFELKQNYPNPFNPVTQINFSVGKTSDITIKVYDILGNTVQVLVNENLKSGVYKTDFNASGLASGTYFYSLYSNGERLSTKKMLIVK